MNLWTKITEFLRLRKLAAYHRAHVKRAFEDTINEHARINIVRHRNRVERAIYMNGLSDGQAQAVRDMSRDYVIAYQRGRIADIETINGACLNYAHKLGEENRRKRAEREALSFIQRVRA